MDKISIAIIDNNLIQRNVIYEMLEEYLRMANFRVSIQEFDSGPALIRDISERGKYDIYIMEVTMPDMNGILLGEKLRSSGDQGCIIYLSNNPNDAYRAFQVKASDYILFQFMRERLPETLDDVFYSIMNRRVSPVIDIKFKTGLMRVPVNSIIYVDIVDRALCFHMENGKMIKTNCVRGTFLQALEDAIGYLPALPEFVLVGRTHFLNISYLREMRRGNILLKTGEIVYIPRSAEKALYKAWKQYLL